MNKVIDNYQKFEINYDILPMGPTLYKSHLNEYVVKELLKRGKKLKTSHVPHLAGHINKELLYDKKDCQWFAEQITPHMQAYREAHNRTQANSAEDEMKTVQFRLDSLWINFMKNGEYNPPHTHSQHLSFVTYLKIDPKIKDEYINFKGNGPGPGGITFTYGEPSRPQWQTSERTIFPEVGEIYIFPALLRHYVAPYKTKGERVSVSGNFEISEYNSNAKYGVDFF